MIENGTLPVLYSVPKMLEEQNMSAIACKKLGIEAKELDWQEWDDMLERAGKLSGTVSIALVGKYVQLHDAYLSVVEALKHGGYENDVDVEIKWVDAELLTPKNVAEELSGCDGILVPGGFGDRGVEGMITAANFARTSGVPYLGLCLGLQVAVIEFARGVLGFQDANSREFAPKCGHCVIDLMPDQQGNIPLGGTMRLGAYPCVIKPNTRLAKMYGAELVSERHRHRYEVNPDYKDRFEEAGLVFSGTSPDGRLAEAVELTGHPFFAGVQFHPEFKSRPNRAHPLFREFIRASKHRQPDD